MAQDDVELDPNEGELEHGLNDARKALLRVHLALAAFKEDLFEGEPRQPKLEEALRWLGALADDEEAPTSINDELENLGEKLPDSPGHGIPLTELALTAIDVAAHQRDDSERLELFTRIAAQLLPRGLQDVNAAQQVARDLRAAAEKEKRARWTEFARLSRESHSPLHPDVAGVRDAWCDDSIEFRDSEVPVRIATFFKVDRARAPFEHLGWAAMPHNWPLFNSFFCSLDRRPDLDQFCSGTTGAPDLSPGLERWRGVYEERVAKCMEGAFPDTYLLFTWRCQPGHLILRYELNPRSDKTVLKVDQGYIQIDEVGRSYHVSTIKHLLFDEDRRASGGQTLALYACQLGWLDYSINQFTQQAQGQRARHPGAGALTMDTFHARDRLLAVLAGCADRAETSAHMAAAQLDDCVRFVREGGSVEEHAKQQVTTTVGRVAQDAAQCLKGHVDLARASAAVVRGLGDG